MRRLLYILLMVTTLAGVFGSCRHTPGEAEARLKARLQALRDWREGRTDTPPFSSDAFRR